MEDFDYYSVMEKRIRFLSKKYDPFNKLPLEWESIREKQNIVQVTEPEIKPRKRLVKQVSEVYNSIVTLFF